MCLKPSGKATRSTPRLDSLDRDCSFHLLQQSSISRKKFQQLDFFLKSVSIFSCSSGTFIHVLHLLLHSVTPRKRSLFFFFFPRTFAPHLQQHCQRHSARFFSAPPSGTRTFFALASHHEILESLYSHRLKFNSPFNFNFSFFFHSPRHLSTQNTTPHVVRL